MKKDRERVILKLLENFMNKELWRLSFKIITVEANQVIPSK